MLKNNCTVNICALDISKAFDRVDHYKLFNVLMDRSLPTGLQNVLSACDGAVTALHCPVGLKF